MFFPLSLRLPLGVAAWVKQSCHSHFTTCTNNNPKPYTRNLEPLNMFVCPCLQVILVSASLRANSLQTATAWTDRDPITICSEAPADATPAARAAAAAAEAGQAVKQSTWGQMLPDTISHQVGRQGAGVPRARGC